MAVSKTSIHANRDRELELFLKELLSLGREDELVRYAKDSRDIDYRTVLGKFTALREGNHITFTTRHSKVIREWRNRHFGDNPHYYWMLSELSSTHADQTKLKSYLGQYTQIYATTSPPNFKRGFLSIRESNGAFTYESEIRYSDPYTIEREGRQFVKFKGFVFYLRNHLYFSGLGSNYSRPMACYPVPEGKQLCNVVLPGLVLGLVTDSHDLYARTFVLFHESNRAMSLLSDQEISSYLAQDQPLNYLHIKRPT